MALVQEWFYIYLLFYPTPSSRILVLVFPQPTSSLSSILKLYKLSILLNYLLQSKEFFENFTLKKKQLILEVIKRKIEIVC